MASIYKRKQDKGRKRTCWFIGYTDHTGKRITVKGFTDKGETERLAAKLEHEVMLRKRGLIDPEQESAAQRRRTPLKEHLKAFQKSLAKNTPKHVKLMMARIQRIVDGCELETIGDIRIEAVEQFLIELAEEEDLGHRTYNHYVQALDAFCRWMILTKRSTTNPILGMERLNTAVDIRHARRALTAEQIGKLVQSARESGAEIQCYDGETRARIYILSYMTGLRRNEIASLSPRSFNIDGEQPTVTVEAAFSKHRRKDVLPLHPELVTMLREWLEGTDPEVLLFPKLAKRRTWLMVKMDLERIGIPYETPEGIADFHAAGRHTHITELLRNGATLPEAKELARHSDIKMTMRYTHIGMEDQAKAVRHLPWKPPVSGSEPSKIPPPLTPGETPGEKSWECSGSESGVSACQDGALGDTIFDLPPNDETPVNDRGCRDFSPSDSESQEWRRRESNPRPVAVLLRLLRV
jgi:integrase/recombinase XerD